MDASLTVILVAAIVAGLYMAWAIGANDVANSMGTSVGSGAITVGVAILIAGVFEFLGAFLAGGEVTSTIRKGIIDADALEHDPNLLVIGMLSALLAAAVWLTVASRFGWPVSTTHSIVGAIIGFAVVAIGSEAVPLVGRDGHRSKLGGHPRPCRSDRVSPGAERAAADLRQGRSRRFTRADTFPSTSSPRCW